MRAFLTKYKDLNNRKLFLGTAFLLRFIVLAGLLIISGRLHNIILQPDDGSYFSAVDHFMQSGCYYYINHIPFAGRMPGYSLVYMLLRFVFSPHISNILIIILQFTLSSIAAYILCLVSYQLFKSQTAAILVFFLYCIGIYPAVFDLWITGESFSISALIISVYYLIRYLDEQKAMGRNLFLSGLFLTWAIFLRPYIGLYILIFPCFIIYYMYFRNKEKIKQLALALVFFCAPFAIAEGAWIIRNYISLHQFIPLEEDMDLAYGKLYSKSWLYLDHMVFNWGEDAANFDQGTLGHYYRDDSAAHKYPFPKQIFNKVTTYNADSLIHLKDMYMKYLYSKDTNEDKKLEQRIMQLCILYQDDYIAHNKAHFFFIKPLKDLKILILSGGYRYIPYKMEKSKVTVQSAVKILSALLYFFVIFCGMAGMAYCMAKKINLPYTVFISLLLLTVVLTVVLYSEIQEPRYFVHAFIVLLLFASYFLSILPRRKAN